MADEPEPNKPADAPVDKPVDQPADKPADKPAEPVGAQPPAGMELWQVGPDGRVPVPYNGQVYMVSQQQASALLGEYFDRQRRDAEPTASKPTDEPAGEPSGEGRHADDYVSDLLSRNVIMDAQTGQPNWDAARRMAETSELKRLVEDAGVEKLDELDRPVQTMFKQMAKEAASRAVIDAEASYHQRNFADQKKQEAWFKGCDKAFRDVVAEKQLDETDGRFLLTLARESYDQATQQGMVPSLDLWRSSVNKGWEALKSYLAGKTSASETLHKVKPASVEPAGAPTGAAPDATVRAPIFRIGSPEHDKLVLETARHVIQGES